MLAAERHERILASLASEGSVIAAELATTLAVSHDTVRRDLQELAARGLLRRVHGGALPPNSTPLDYAARARQATAAKRALAKAGVRLLRHGSVIVLGGGTTVVELAREIPHDLRATIFTTSAPVAIELASRPLIDLHVIGGRFEKAALETAGPAAVDALRAVRADVCLFSVWAIRPAEGLTVGHVDDAPTLQAMIAGAAEVVGLATADKLDTVQPFVVAPIEELTHLVTERSAEERLVSPYKRIGLTVVHG